MHHNAVNPARAVSSCREITIKYRVKFTYVTVKLGLESVKIE